NSTARCSGESRSGVSSRCRTRRRRSISETQQPREGAMTEPAAPFHDMQTEENHMIATSAPRRRAQPLASSAFLIATLLALAPSASAESPPAKPSQKGIEQARAMIAGLHQVCDLMADGPVRSND